MKDSTKLLIYGLILSVIGLLSIFFENNHFDAIMISTWMCIIGSSIIEKLEKPQP